MKYRRKPNVIDAWQFDGTMQSYLYINEECEHKLSFTGILDSLDGTGKIIIPNEHGTVTARANDWVIRGVKGEYYPCEPDVFAQIYERMPDDDLAPFSYPPVGDTTKTGL